MRKDKRKAFAIISDVGEVAGVHLKGSEETVPAIFLTEISATHHIAHSHPFKHDIEPVWLTVEPYKEKTPRKKAAKPKRKKLK